VLEVLKFVSSWYLKRNPLQLNIEERPADHLSLGNHLACFHEVLNNRPLAACGNFIRKSSWWEQSDAENSWRAGCKVGKVKAHHGNRLIDSLCNII